MGTIILTPADSPATVLFAGKATLTFTGRSADGSFVDPDNGGSACTFAGTIDLAAQADAGNTGVTVLIPAAGSEQNVDISGFDITIAGFYASSGLNGDDGGAHGDTGSDDFTWLTSSTAGTDSSITDSGADGSVTFNWTDAPTGRCFDSAPIFGVEDVI